MQTGDLEIQVKTFFGLENVLAEELKKLGGKNVEVKNRAVNCVGDLGFLYKINYSLRTALKILVPVLTFKAFNESKYYDKLFKFPWDEYMDADQTFAIDATVYSERYSHSQFMTLKMKDAIVDYFVAKHRKRPSIDTKNPDIKFHLHIDRELVTISMDSSGAPLFKRGYRKEQTKAPINEVLAAGMLQLAGWDGKGNFLDPMCGSGTLLVEAGMIAMDLPAQIFRNEFGFMNWKNYDAELFDKIKEFRVNRVKAFDGKIVGYDIDEDALDVAWKNIKAAEMDDIITVKKKNFFDSQKDMFPLLMVFNPPYDERLSISDEEFYKKIGDTFKTHYPNTLAWMISADLEAVKKIGLRPSRKIKLFNGKLECRFLQYEMYEGTKKIHKTEGAS
ncbi:DNA methylase [Elizabethkingia meningoseptica]|uniref:RNA methyltransferase n=1 Tax=Elizabethkingia meningoseptica TaxID=238 RepID=A0A1V3TXN5_ELIME|nr:MULTISPECIES: THUMP domain-containing protein [Elizabethkingia]AQX12986.1 DNA methylase [Elizabethkingia meningoseptica]EJK5330140.1 class I SAM-dependent RNA methyltransferase [Elizabethkingia meningoseptica]MBG0514517.1 class I SAM-dependent RNA methyltransferase [Elizabethkingia meningoseptica]MCL1674583.1 THUMP domain-containing protein [Elizabethkingia meningoseptica]MCL1686218.1 THUMP domain-containing protein [Elizabethkingia meningoseptica]